MKMTEMFLAQLDREVPATRKTLERVPEGKNDWKPHPKSMPLGYLAALVASMPGWIALMVERDDLDLGGGQFTQPALATNRDLMRVFDASIDKARRALSKTTDEHLMTSWRLMWGERLLNEQPRNIMILDGVLSHLAHHRGQLTVYLRLNDIPVPPIYGGTADERF